MRAALLIHLPAIAPSPIPSSLLPPGPPCDAMSRPAPTPPAVDDTPTSSPQTQAPPRWPHRPPAAPGSAASLPARSIQPTPSASTAAQPSMPGDILPHPRSEIHEPWPHPCHPRPPWCKPPTPSAAPGPAPDRWFPSMPLMIVVEYPVLGTFGLTVEIPFRCHPEVTPFSLVRTPASSHRKMA
jgi:hypothetical protein